MVRARCRILGAALSALVLGAGCSQGRMYPDDVIVVAMANTPISFDPRVGADEASQKIHQLLYNHLVRIDEQLRVVPELAETLTNPDPRTYVATLRRGVRFHDGRELTSADVVHTFQSFLNPDFLSPKKGAYRLLESVRAVDPYTVEFRLKEPFGSFPINLVMGIVPAGSGTEIARQPVGTGPYRFGSFAADDRVILHANADYYNGAARNAGLVLKMVPDDTMRGLELRKGSVDLVVNDLAPDIIHTLLDEGRIKVETAPGVDYAYLGFNLRDPLLQDARVRQAIGFAIDRDAIVKYLRRDLAQVATGIIPPLSWAYAGDQQSFTFDPARARRLLDEAGYRDPDGQGSEPRLRLTLKTSTSEVYRVQAAVIQRDLAEVGIALELRSMELATLFGDIIRGNVQLYTLQWVGATDPDMLRRVFHSGELSPGGLNRGHYINPAVDALLERAARSTDDVERKSLYGDVQRAVAKDAPYIGLWYKTNVVVYQPELSGVSLSPIADYTFLQHVRRAPAAQSIQNP
ncbi:MAG: ABC transporter substrate-binding protein [Acidobacteriota bacterium]|nr:ABC transporter substrate-binding protein [Acidobacteriota bacterium]